MKISSDSNKFIIENLHEKKLSIHSENGALSFEKEQGIFNISSEKLLAFYQIENAPLHILNEHDIPIDVSQIDGEIDFSSDTYLSVDDKNYYLYIDQNNLLTLVFNKKPSFFNFYNKDCEIINISRDSKAFTINFTCKYFKPTSLNVFIKDRNHTFEIPLTTSSFKVITLKQHTFQVTANFIIDKNAISNLINYDENIINYNVEAYDLHFNYDIKEMPLSEYPPRIKAPNAYMFKENDEVWGEFENKMCLFKMYNTKHGNLSTRIFIVPKLTYRYYLKMTKNNLEAKSKKPIVIIVEYPEKAQDNGLIFFQYLLNNYSDRFHIYYLLSDYSSDIKNLKGYEDNIIQYQSLEHIKLFERSSVIIHTHTPNYVLPFLTNFLEDKVKSKSKLFLQHGIIASKDVSGIYGRTPSNEFTNLFVVSSEREKNEVINNYNYPEASVILSGLPRFDNIIRHRQASLTHKRSILIMPTWRKEIDQYSDAKFKKTNFFKVFNQLLTNKSLINFLANNNIELNFYLHHNFQKFSHLFDATYINIIYEDEHNVKDLLYESNLLITDYSSVGLDFALMHKKVIYYRPLALIDAEITTEDKHFLPGSIVNTESELLKELQSFEMDNHNKEVLKDIYLYDDTLACQRIVDAMIEKFNL
ncbi:CDP-glycerol glycerophosphotransferase family protein [Staphylococcus durrellii]|uniref:CDP-glycerol glycerophosphotransferase family protein n=1 Tax=Staphylococcus durrellii TaxID=2781773 RepID=UPI0018A12529|nr:CDP-glycerol glycerophosphotransferase family protein [Staphylococcus durrellii]MBF7015969.1 CDP-glycerol glycerophosphotransferase family protein [Staphylococcus durrellii]